MSETCGQRSGVRRAASALVVALLLTGLCAGLAVAQSQRPRPLETTPPTDGHGSVRGVVKPLAEAQITADLGRRIIELPWRDGQRFAKGDLLVRFDCEELETETRAARAAWRGKKAAYANAVELNRRQAAGALSVQLAAADADKAEAEAMALEAKLKRCAISAPFSGRVVERLASPYETPGPTQPILRIVDDSNLEIQLIVPSRWLKWLRVGMEFTFQLDETGEKVRASVGRIGASVDPVSQSVRLAGEFVSRPPDVLSGMSGTAIFEPPTQ